MARPKRRVNPILSAEMPMEKPSRVYRTGGYVRLSVEDSGRPGADTIETQRELIQDYIDSQPDMECCDFYCDNGRTGTNFDRPEFERMMDDVQAGKIECIVVKDLSRFGRSYLETGSYLEHIFPLLGVRFVAVNDHFDTLSAERTQDGYIVPLKNIMNAVYSKDIGRKSRSALLMKQQRGEFIGTWAAYGYQKCAGGFHRIEPDPETAPVVREIFALRLTGGGYRQIARKLNECGIPSPARYRHLKGDAESGRYANTQWSVCTVKRILANEVYLGHMVQGRRRSGFSEGRKPYRVPESEWVIVRGTHEPLIDEDDFRTVQRMGEQAGSACRERLGRYDGLGAIPNILRGLIYCADCKRPLVRYKSVTNQGRNLYYVYICPSHTADLSACPKKYLHETQLKEILWDTLRREAALAENLDKPVRRYGCSAKAAGREQAVKREITAAKQALDRARMCYDRLYQSYADKLVTEQEYIEMKRRYRSDMERAQTRLEALERRQQENRLQTTEKPRLAACGQFKEAQALTQAMARALVERVEVDAGNHISITLRYRDEYRVLLQRWESEEEAGSA